MAAEGEREDDGAMVGLAIPVVDALSPPRGSEIVKLKGAGNSSLLERMADQGSEVFGPMRVEVSPEFLNRTHKFGGRPEVAEP